MRKLSDEQEWSLLERYHLNNMFTAKAREITDDYIAVTVGISPTDVLCILRGRTHKALQKYREKVMTLAAKRDHNKSHAAQHSDKVLMAEFNLTEKEMKSILRTRRG